jgi:DNA replication protein
MPFDGFPAGKLRVTPIPDLFFSELLPQIDDLAELKVTLHILHRVQRAGDLRVVRRAEMLADAGLMRGLAGMGQTATQALDDALAAAVARGAILRLDVSGASGADQWYVPNSESGRKLAADLEGGILQVPDARKVTRPAAVERPSIYTLYEQNIGLLQPIIAEELREADETYPTEWIAEAFKRAVEQNKRKWSYVRAILERWRLEGKTDEANQRDSEAERRRYIQGRYRDYIQH